MSRKTPQLETCDKVLVVEGYSDLLFFAEALEHLGQHGDIFIKHFNGKADLEAKLKVFLTPDLLAQKSTIGVIVDADEDEGKTTARISQVLQKATSQLITLGQWTVGKPKVGLFVAPGSGATGEIESLVWRAWGSDPSNQPAKACIDTFIDCMASSGHQAKSPDKGRVSALLAIRNDEDPRLGPGARAKVFDFNRPEFQPLLEFLSGL